MAQTDDEINADIVRLQEALGRPERTIELSDGRRISFDSIEDIQKAIAAKQRQLSTAVRQSRQYRMTHSKGY